MHDSEDPAGLNLDTDMGRGAIQRTSGSMRVMGEIWRTAPTCDGCGCPIWGFVGRVSALSKAEKVGVRLICHDCLVERRRELRKRQDGRWYGIGYVKRRHRFRDEEEDGDERGHSSDR
jgi:hypothetical protein